MFVTLRVSPQPGQGRPVSALIQQSGSPTPESGNRNEATSITLASPVVHTENRRR